MSTPDTTPVGYTITIADPSGAQQPPGTHHTWWVCQEPYRIEDPTTGQHVSVSACAAAQAHATFLHRYKPEQNATVVALFAAPL